MMTATQQNDHEASVPVERSFAIWLEVERFNSRYAATLDRGNLEEWPDFFVDEEPLYRIVSRENYDNGMPAAVIYCDSKGMLVDRVNAILNTIVFAPRYTTHFVSNLVVDELEGGRAIAAESNFLLIESAIDRNPKVIMAGRYLDRFVRSAGRLRLQERLCIYDTLTVQTSVILPV